MLRTESVGNFQQLDRVGVYSCEGVLPVGTSSVSSGFKRPQPVSSVDHPVSFLSQFVLIDSHFLSLRIDLFRVPDVMQAGG